MNRCTTTLNLSESEINNWILGENAAEHIRRYLESPKSEFDKHYLIKQILIAYEFANKPN